MANTVNVTGISASTTEAQLNDFFTFCGHSIDYEEKSGKATIAFEKATAAKTALMLNGGTLDGATLTVTSDVVHQDDSDPLPQGHDTEHVKQEDKPRAGIAAEYLAKGYQLSDNILARAIELDQQKGISKKFLDYVQHLDKTIGERALGPDQTVSGKAQQTVESAHQQAEQKGYVKAFRDYYTRALATPIGQKVREFYTTTSKQIHDIQEEARRIATEEKAKQGGSGATPVPPVST
ncbi:hypothetical protein CC2G_012945 [Coprinopsis cinerea AmutBmut pab1-1]|nr:hypothetical protein CC2G_012945 [Coprinopsis cinerea AmutBmut pab1-1]